jgi:hypothetical protein
MLLFHQRTKNSCILPDFLNLVKLSPTLYRKFNKVLTAELDDRVSYRSFDIDYSRIRSVVKIVLDKLYSNGDKVVEISRIPGKGRRLSMKTNPVLRTADSRGP